MKKILIGQRWIGEGEPCLIIAEAACNHNGDIYLAKKLIDIAIESGADAVKFQKFVVDKLVSKKVSKEAEKHYEMLKRLELSDEAFVELFDYAVQRGIIFLATPFEEVSAEFLHKLGVVAYKISAGDLNNLPLLKIIATKGLPILLSTGMSTLEEVEESVSTIKNADNDKICLMHCISAYPTSINDVNLRTMLTLKQVFDLPVGFSDHTIGITAAVTAVALGAHIVEKHFTINKALSGPDHFFSINPEELKVLVKEIRMVEESMGSDLKILLKCEEEIRAISRKSIIALQNIPQGTVITRESVDIRRPGIGLPPKFLNLIIGKITNQDINEGSLIHWHNIRT